MSLNIVAIGELLWDVLPSGKKLGGAPSNFIYHCSKSGSKSFLLSAVGKDKLGNDAISQMKDKNIDSNYIQINDKRTSTVEIKISDAGVPTYNILDDVAWDYIQINKENKILINKADILYFGTLAQRNSYSKRTITKLLSGFKNKKLVVYDLNLRKNYYSKKIIFDSIHNSNILKLNLEELKILTNLKISVKETKEKQLEYLLKKFDLKLIALTMGEKGSMLVTKSEISYLPAIDVKIIDTVGAGDAFTASAVISFANGINLNQIHHKAIEIASFVCSKNGGMPNYN